jgi:hypothetical protein
VDERGWAWAGTADGVRYRVGDQWLPYTATHGLRSGPVKALLAGGQVVVVAGPTGLDRLSRHAVPGQPPTAQIASVVPLTVTCGGTLTLSGNGADGDEEGQRIVAWKWASDRDGPLCSAAACALPHALLTPGRHVLAFRVQDDEGVWSEAVTRTLAVQEVWRAYLPLAIRGR